MHYSPSVLVLSLPCTSAIRPAWILHALRQGFDGVFIASDGDECAYLPDCSERSSRIVADAQALLAEHGIDGRRLKMGAICSVCAAPFTEARPRVLRRARGAGRLMDYDVLVVGSGIGGMESALKLGDMGYKVLVVEKDPSIGGKMILLSKVFPTLDCASCISTPKMAATVHHPNVTVFTGSEVGDIVRNGDRQLPCDRPSQAALRRRVPLHGLPAVRAGVHGRAARPVQRRARLPESGLHPLPAGDTAEGARRARGHLAVLIRLPGRDQGARLRLARPQRRVREGVRPRTRDDTARRQPRPRLLRAVRGAVHTRQPGGPGPDSAAEALRRRHPLLARRSAAAGAARTERQAGRRRRLRPCRPHRSLAAGATRIRRQDLRGGAGTWWRSEALHPVLPSAGRGRRARRGQRHCSRRRDCDQRTRRRPRRAQAERLRRGTRGHRHAELGQPSRSRRGASRRLQRARVPARHQARRAARRARQGRCRDRRRQRRNRRRAQRAPARCGHGAHGLSRAPRRNARVRLGSRRGARRRHRAARLVGDLAAQRRRPRRGSGAEALHHGLRR